jgi:hypothetical protein
MEMNKFINESKSDVTAHERVFQTPAQLKTMSIELTDSGPYTHLLSILKTEFQFIFFHLPAIAFQGFRTTFQRNFLILQVKNLS